jgi:hypothetical protein
LDCAIAAQLPNKINAGLDVIFETVSSMQNPEGAWITTFLENIIAREVGGTLF